MVGTGRTTTIKQLLEKMRNEEEKPDDILYVNNFKNPDEPTLIILPAGKGNQFKEAMELLIGMLKSNIPELLKSKYYTEKRDEIVESAQKIQKETLKEFEEEVAKESFSVIQVQMGMFVRPDLIPVIEGKPTPFNQLDIMVREGKFPKEKLEELQKKYMETNPNYLNIFGSIEATVSRSGVWQTDFTKIKAGSLLKANGGYLVMNALDTLVELGVWQTLKRTLKYQTLEIQNLASMYLISASRLKPEPIDIDVKVVLIGDAHIYNLLYFLDADFKKIFKIKSEFDSVTKKDNKTIMEYAQFIKKICDEDKLHPFNKQGIAAIIEYGTRLAGKQKKISTRFHILADVIREACYWSKKDNIKHIDRGHVEKAISERFERVSLIEDKIQEMIEEGTIMIDTDGSETGQVNGLSVYAMGEFSFGKPTRITASTAVGKAGVINIEREADMSGRTHNKGVLILGGYLRGLYAQNKPFSLSASLAFEQSYGGVDGDSASSTEVYAILSSLSKLPLRQDIAVTGSLNQKGEIQPIGGVNEKIEGFYEVCKAKSLTGDQGVIIPHQNAQNLMLRKEVIDSVSEGKFHIYPIKTIDEGIEILTGIKAGKRQKNGTFSKETVNYLVDQELQRLAKSWKTFSAPSNKDKGKESA